MTKKDLEKLVLRIASRLTGIDIKDLMMPERQIFLDLYNAGILDKTKEGEVVSTNIIP